MVIGYASHNFQYGGYGVDMSIILVGHTGLTLHEMIYDGTILMIPDGTIM